MSKDTVLTNIVIGEFKNSGINNVDVDLIVKKWNHLWVISQYKATFTLSKNIRKDSEELGFKSRISAEQAEEIIEKVVLTPEKVLPFRFAITWRKI